MIYGNKYMIHGRQLRPSDFEPSVRARYGRKPPRAPHAARVQTVRNTAMDAEQNAQLSQLARDTAARTVYVHAGEYSDSHKR